MIKLGFFNRKKKRKYNIKDMYGMGWYVIVFVGERSNWKELVIVVFDLY